MFLSDLKLKFTKILKPQMTLKIEILEEKIPGEDEHKIWELISMDCTFGRGILAGKYT